MPRYLEMLPVCRRNAEADDASGTQSSTWRVILSRHTTPGAARVIAVFLSALSACVAWVTILCLFLGWHFSIWEEVLWQADLLWCNTGIGLVPAIGYLGWKIPMDMVLSLPAAFGGMFVLSKLRYRSVIEPQCRKCGYILRGLSKPRCPDCGEPI